MYLMEFVPDTDIRAWVGPFRDKHRYLETGQIEAERAIALSDLDSSNSMVDLGCGCGRMAIHFANYLSSAGRYLGMDCCAPLIEWCVNAIQPKFSNLKFQFLDVYNGSCNPAGKIPPSKMKLDLPSAEVDMVVANSLFTHMLLPDVECYMNESRRVLKRGGRLVATFFLLNKMSLEAISSKSLTYDFVFDAGNGSISRSSEAPEDAIAHVEAKVSSMIQNAGFHIKAIHYGGWVKNSLENHQDTKVAVSQD